MLPKADIAFLMGSLPVQPQSKAQHSSRDPGPSVAEMEAAPSPPVPTDERTFVAVGKESKSTVEYAAKKAGGNKIVLLHVHQPEQRIPMLLGGKFSVHNARPAAVREHRERERIKMDETLDQYKQICEMEGVPVDMLVIQMDDIEKGILQLLAERGIVNLVMGAAADRHLSSCKRMLRPRSKKAIRVGEEAPASCRISFVCKGNLICTREPSPEGPAVMIPPWPVASPTSISLSQSTSSSSMRSPSMPSLAHRLTNQIQDLLFRSKSYNYTHGCSSGGLTPRSPSAEGSQRTMLEIPVSSVQDGIPPTPASPTSKGEASSTSPGLLEMRDQSLIFHSSLTERDYQDEVGSLIWPIETKPQENATFNPPPNGLVDDEGEERVYAQLERAVEEAEVYQWEAHEKMNRWKKAGKAAIEAGQKASLGLKAQIASLNRRIIDLEEKLVATEKLLSTAQRERDEAVRLVEEMCQKNEDAANIAVRSPRDFSEFGLSELEEATRGFHQSMKIGEGGFGRVYKGVLRQTLVAVKKLNPDGKQGQREFQQEVSVLSKVRHPCLVTLIGTCPEAGALIYEYLHNGSLEDRLHCKNNSPPLPWQTRIQIAADICLALIFLHSSRPDSIVHGDLKPANILLDSNHNAKLGDFGISRLIPQTNSATTSYLQTYYPKGTFAYVDPEFTSTGVLTPRSDVYSFGIVILQLLTRRQAVGIAKEVMEALERGYFQHVLDRTAGDWPFDQAKQLAEIGLRCCEMNRKSRPDLASEVWRVLQPMTALVGSASLAALETMQDPQVAADSLNLQWMA